MSRTQHFHSSLCGLGLGLEVRHRGRKSAAECGFSPSFSALLMLEYMKRLLLLTLASAACEEASSLPPRAGGLIPSRPEGRGSLAAVREMHFHLHVRRPHQRLSSS